ncbi:hypothetical protein DSCA_61200 [Desulfosarcina alkanivorans]|jgi:hypothetical protein|uniref:Lipoprotein n=1 Tax=Desulfosarcina alkanivorans TaxID=571177 RepID=A0A5K7YV44_9BACT|nr:hypothetical protein [Desulfosarcina alkanivorans]BBO72190.1 hypothetical protein DSCA_61200 [Desulfosarcina alkanivorans]
MRNKSILVAIAILMMSGCALPRTFGPYSGKVVDAENNAPIKGVAVAVWFSTKSPSMGGTVWKVADAVETLTDAKGEFTIPPHRIKLFKIMASWDDECQVSVFKPGYGAYPGNLKTYCSWKEKHPFFIPEEEHVTYYLPKLLIFDDRRENYVITPGGKTDEKLPTLMKYMDEWAK